MSSVPYELQSGVLTIRLGREDEAVDLSLLEQLAERLRSAFREIVKEQTGEAKAHVKLLVRDAHKGSIVLSVEPILEGEGVPSGSEVARTIIEDITALGQQQARPDMSANLLGHYRELVKIGERAGRLEIGFDGASSMLGPENHIQFEAAIREQPEAGVELVGTIETVNIHSRPWTFGLYTKFDRQRVECRFAEPMLVGVLSLMDAHSLVQVKGEARFAPVGTTPRTIELDEAPTVLEFDADALLSYRRSTEITRKGESASAAILRIREEIAGFG
ncbi:MAG: hypothetical protein BroJett009_05660 [Armatimonadota bacterium]|nr:MAG: hypothetical protein BroJett009_05660 [Armatimonadota bacterium]